MLKQVNDTLQQKSLPNSKDVVVISPPQKVVEKPVKRQENVSAESLEDSKRVFEETVKKVKKQFFNYNRENACAENEKVFFLLFLKMFLKRIIYIYIF